MSFSHAIAKKLLIFIVMLLRVYSYEMGTNSKQRALDLISQMTLEEKIIMLHGNSDDPTNEGYVGYVPAIDRLHIPALKLNDAGSGFRDDQHPGTSTCWPSTLAVAATFDTQLTYNVGVALGEEFSGKGSNILLGPGLNIARVPLNGRNFEYLSGGDPYLGRTLVGPMVKGIQSQGVIATAKHWVLNNQVSR